MLAIRAGRVFDGERVVDRPTVVVEDTAIVAVGVEPPAGAEIVDLPGATLLPGLIDCHQHLCFDGNGTLEEQVTGIDDDALLERAAGNARRALRAGVTTIRDLGDRRYLTLALRDDPSLPTILSAGPPITVDGGHCWYLGGECAPDDSALRAAVAERAERGCDVVKVMVSGGALTPTYPMWESQFSTEQLRVIVDEARRRGLPIAAHCHGSAAIDSAVDAGVDTIEHCTFFSTDGRSDPTDELIDRISASGIAVAATVGTVPGGPLPPIIAANIETVLTARRRIVEQGGVVVGGSDAGVGPNKPHDVLPRAFGDFQAAGMTPLQALTTMTSTAADVLGVGDRKGRLASGYHADIVAIAGDPIANPDPEALLGATAVWHRGRRVPD